MSETASQKANAADQETTTTIVGAIAIVLAVLATVLRFYTRLHMHIGLWWDDWLSLIAVIAAVAAGVLVLVASLLDPDAAWLLSENDPNYEYTAANQMDLKLAFIADILYFTIIGAAKSSILLMYTRIFAVSRSFRYQVWVLGGIVTLFWVACTFATMFNCWPIKWSWLNSLSPASHCINYNIFWLSMGIFEEVLDICILALPLRQTLKLQLSSQKKIGVICIFLLGGLVIITGIVKVVEGWNAHPGARSPLWDKTEIWSSVHASIGILCACLPVCWPILILRSSIFRLPGILKVKSSGKVRTWWRSHKTPWSSSFKSSSRQYERDPESSEVLPYRAAPTELLPMSRNHIQVDTHIEVQYPSVVWDEAHLAANEIPYPYYYAQPQVSHDINTRSLPGQQSYVSQSQGGYI